MLPIAHPNFTRDLRGKCTKIQLKEWMDAALDKADNMMDAARNVAIAHFRKSAGQYVFSETIS